MSIAQRIVLLIRLFSRRVMAWIERILPPCDPADAALKQAQELRQRLVDVAAGTMRLEQEAEKQRRRVRQLDDQAGQWLTSGREDLARLAIARKARALEQLDALERERRESADEERALVRASAAVIAQLDALSARRTRVDTRHELAAAGLSARESLAEITRAVRALDAHLEQRQDEVFAFESLANKHVLDRQTGTTHIEQEARDVAQALRVEDELASRQADAEARRARLEGGISSE